MDLCNYRAIQPFLQKHLLTLADYTSDEILQLLALAAKLKGETKQGILHPHLQGKNLAMIFSKPSMRTRVSFQVGMNQLGGNALYLSPQEIGLGTRESVADVARVLSRFVNGIMIRTFAQSDVEGLARYGSIPVINGLTDDYHPCQVLADFLTLYEAKGTFEGLKLAYLGDGNNMAHSLMLISAKLGVDISIGCPKGYEPDPAVTKTARDTAKGSKITVTFSPEEAVSGADAVYTDVWASMGQEAEAEARKAIFQPFQVNAKLMAAAKPDAIFLHCLPAHRDDEVTDEVIESAASRVFDEAENRLHAQKAVMAMLMGKMNPV